MDLPAGRNLEVLGTASMSVLSDGLLQMSGGSLKLTNTLSNNSGRILMNSVPGSISGGTISNTGTITGTGKITSYLSTA
ncbi:MAG: hypothetical protein LC114_12955, partial [Bryobacterales bacterium]|nr:hypothetical protein [Bryobacterales bacterium]